MIKEIPSDTKFFPTMFLDGENSYAEQHYRNNLFKITMITTRKYRKSKFVRHFIHDDIEGSFKSIDDLNAAIKKENEK